MSIAIEYTLRSYEKIIEGLGFAKDVWKLSLIVIQGNAMYERVIL